MSERRVLESWKGIAAYLGRTVKTCLKWEHELGLPVHRLEDSPKAHVFAYSDELDRWKEQTFKAVKARAEAPHGFRRFCLLLQRLRRPWLGIPVLLALTGVAVSAVWFFDRESKIRNATRELLPQISQLIEEEEYFGAFKLAQQAQRYIEKDPSLQKEWQKFTAAVSVVSTPPGADVSIKDYRSTGSDWENLGRTPIQNVVIPLAFLRWKIEKPGYAAQECAVDPRLFTLRHLGRVAFRLREGSATPENMIWLQGTLEPHYALYTGQVEPVPVGGFWIDKYEVMNRQFKEFLDGGGYEKREFWKEPFIRDGQALTWEEAMKEFRDRTGQAGPAFWELGKYPEGQDDYPVSGVSWYEAAAYAEFRGKSLPTIYHWLLALNFVDKVQYYLPLSNINGKGPSRVGSFQGMSACGVYDMMGNVKEWCWNEIKGRRFVVGGAWDDMPYMATMPFSKSPFDRGPDNGFRCVRCASPEGMPARLRQPVVMVDRDYSRETPVTDEVFEVYRRLYAYDKAELEARIEKRDETAADWIREKVTFNAAYDRQRMIGHLFLPRKGRPPYETVIFYPSGWAFVTPSSANLGPEVLDFLLARGRAVFYPVFLSSFERQDGYNLFNRKRRSWTDHCFKWLQDLSVSIDYLETRSDINKDRLAFYGLSQGAIVGPILLALEPRLKAGILEGGGFPEGGLGLSLAPEADPFHFAPRVKVPVLLLNGRYDIVRRVDGGQDQLFLRLGTPPADKFHKVYETDHYAPRLERIKEVTAFLDKYLK